MGEKYNDGEIIIKVDVPYGREPTWKALTRFMFHPVKYEILKEPKDDSDYISFIVRLPYKKNQTRKYIEEELKVGLLVHSEDFRLNSERELLNYLKFRFNLCNAEVKNIETKLDDDKIKKYK